MLPPALRIFLAFLAITAVPAALSPAPTLPAVPALCAACVRADMNFLASDALRGRGSATRDEHLAALYAASLFASFGLEPGGDDGTFLQKAALPAPLPEPLRQRLSTFEAVPRTETWNAVAILPGTLAGSPTDKTQPEAILLTAHLDHLGIGPAVQGDTIYNGADDDASGTTAVLELARALAAHNARPLAGGAPRRTIIFALFGSEEIGGFGNRYFLDHPPVPLDHILANLEFEMIGRPDPAVPVGRLWLTGWERTDLGPALVAHGARLAPDPHPEQKFFTRSDNYALARRGIVAQTVSSFNLHKDYHQPSDELERIDFPYMIDLIGSMVRPIEWLATSSYKPQWKPGEKP